MKKYDLFFQDIMIGKTTVKEYDFPSCFGEFELTNMNLPEHINDYISYSIEAQKLMEHDESEWEKFMEANEYKYADLIESEDWYLIDEQGKKEEILVPIFEENGITWRWNLKTNSETNSKKNFLQKCWSTIKTTIKKFESGRHPWTSFK